MPLDLDYADDDDSIKRHKFVWHAGEVGVPRSDAATAGELLKFLYVDDSPVEMQRRLVYVYLTSWPVPERVERELTERGLWPDDPPDNPIAAVINATGSPANTIGSSFRAASSPTALARNASTESTRTRREPAILIDANRPSSMYRRQQPSPYQ